MASTTAIERRQEGDLLVTLAGLVHRNRLTLVMLAANLGLVGTRARDAAVTSAPARWLSRNATALRLFLASLSILLRAFEQPGYRAIQDVRRPYRRRRAPRLLRHRLDRRTGARTVLAVGTMRHMPPYVVSLF